MAAYFRHRDTTRIVHYEGGGSATVATDLICPMYARRSQIEKLAEQHSERPVVLCEYAHAMGNSSGAARSATLVPCVGMVMLHAQMLARMLICKAHQSFLHDAARARWRRCALHERVHALILN